MPLTGKTVLITGAARGIGAAAVRLFAQLGCNVVIHYNSSKAEAAVLAHELERHTSGKIWCVQADVTKSEQVQAMVDAAEARFGGVDILVNNAGIADICLFSDITPENWQHMFDVHVNGAFYCTQAVLPHMIRQKQGKIINVSSMWGITGASCEVHYSAAKAALIGMTKALAKELGPSNIQVNCVAPGVIETAMNAALTPADRAAVCGETPLGRLGSAEEAAHSIVFLAGEGSNFITGQVLSPNGGIVI